MSVEACVAGDSVKSVLTDLCCCGLGYFLGAIFLALEMVWLSGLWIAASEVRSLQHHWLNISASKSSF